MHRNRNGFLASAVRLGAAGLALVLGTAGLALAGVDLPDPADKAFERVGISLPSQADGAGRSADHARSDEVQAVIEATAPSDRGCEFGHRVAEAAKGSPLPEKARAACTRGKPPETGSARGASKAKGASGGAGRAFGQDTAARARGLRDATVEQRRKFGKDTADRAQQLGGAPTPAPAQGPPSGPPSGPPADTPSGPPPGTPGGRP